MQSLPSKGLRHSETVIRFDRKLDVERARLIFRFMHKNPLVLQGSLEMI